MTSFTTRFKTGARLNFVVASLALLLQFFATLSESSLSTGLRFSVTDLNDFIAPEEKCILPMQGGISTKAPGSVASPLVPRQRGKRRKKQLSTGPKPDQRRNETLEITNTNTHKKKTKSKTKTASNAKRDDVVATVTLSDCLSCSGCVTSSEEILLEKHSANALVNASADATKLCVVSLSPQACASLASAYNLTGDEAEEKLCWFLKSIGVKRVFTTALSTELALAEACEEFVERWHLAKRKANCSAVPQQDIPSLPVICTECPGFVLFGEKKYPQDLIHLFSQVKSPQAITGTLVKRILANTLRDQGNASCHGDPRPEGIDLQGSEATMEGEGGEASVWHCAVMPCLDKKLESARDELTMTEALPRASTEHRRPETDCVVTTRDLAALISKRSSIPLPLLPRAPLDTWHAVLSTNLVSPTALPNRNRTTPAPPASASSLPSAVPLFSNGYLETVARYAARAIFGIELPGRLTTHLPRDGNTDVQELTVHGPNGTALRFAIVYGFRHIQNLVRDIQRRTCPYDYVEVMSCPSGCTNGGAQMPSQPLPLVNRRFAQDVVRPHMDRTAETKAAIAAALLTAAQSDPRIGAETEDGALPLLRTTFRARPMSLAAKLEEW